MQPLTASIPAAGMTWMVPVGPPLIRLAALQVLPLSVEVTRCTSAKSLGLGCWLAMT